MHSVISRCIQIPDDWKNKPFVLKSPNLNEEFRMEVNVDNLYTTYGNRSVGLII